MRSFTAWDRQNNHILRSISIFFRSPVLYPLEAVQSDSARFTGTRVVNGAELLAQTTSFGAQRNGRHLICPVQAAAIRLMACTESTYFLLRVLLW